MYSAQGNTGVKENTLRVSTLSVGTWKLRNGYLMLFGAKKKGYMT